MEKYIDKSDITILPKDHLTSLLLYGSKAYYDISNNLILNETISIPKLTAFIFIWIAVIIFVIDVFREKKINESRIQSPN